MQEWTDGDLEEVRRQHAEMWQKSKTMQQDHLKDAQIRIDHFEQRKPVFLKQPDFKAKIPPPSLPPVHEDHRSSSSEYNDGTEWKPFTAENLGCLERAERLSDIQKVE